MLSDLELRAAFRGAEDMWQLVERFQEENGGGPDVQRVRGLAASGATVLRPCPSSAPEPRPHRRGRRGRQAVAARDSAS